MRNELLDINEILSKSQVQAGMHVADFGCGKTGPISLAAAQLVGNLGVVYAIDIIKDFLEEIKKIAAITNLNNISTVWTNLETVGRARVPEKSLNVIFISNILARAKERLNILNEAKRLLQNKGRITVVDWKKTGLFFSPKQADLLPFGEIVEWGIKNGFSVQEEFYPGEYHRGLILYRHE